MRYATEIVIEIKQSYPGRLASNPFIGSHRMCKVFPLSNDFLIENGHFREIVENHQNPMKISVPTELCDSF